MDIDLVLECSGSFKDRETAEIHLESGAPKLLFSQPAKPDVDATIVFGINQQLLSSQQRIVSAASCTTNCIVPVIKALNEALEIEYGSITTIHSAMNDQPVIDAYNQHDLRLTRSALQSIIPVDTGLAKGIDRLLPELQGCFKASSIRVPTANVSCMDLCVHVKKTTSEAEVNHLLHQATYGQLEGILGVTYEPHASVDDARSCVVDGSITTIHSAMNDQPVIDAYNQHDLRLTRSALQSIIPVDTGLAKGIDRLLPELQGCFKASSIRVPTANVSCMDLCVHVKKTTSEAEVNHLLHQATYGQLEGILGVTYEPHASVDFNHDARSCVVDATQTNVTSGKLIKLLCWFDNEWAFANRMLDVANYWLRLH